MMSDIHELRYQLRVKDKSALWDVALSKALSYPDVTPETVVEMIGPREDVDIMECLLLLSQLSISGCDVLTLDCRFISDVHNILSTMNAYH